ncbi:Phenylpyruvate C(3)-methyltransferase [Colletotrichum siamense]|uniref:Phenylpyruvate C(3)-methyltransferase n=1 Tax=Colletotrichum siamense TaxID=690259 RepID=UPI0018729B7E|nr:Phenylpyruvate C(3)-methyltransferase [Colletotrichum siamense]KAF5497446.1 Phenylpyruvate C(3)-methyltransferase [Colletotrichum siamense]
MGSISNLGPITTSSEQDVTKIFNSYIAASAIGAAWEVGLLDEIRKGKPVNVDKFAAQHNLDVQSTHGLVLALSAAEILKREGAFISPGRLLEDAYRTKSLFHWLALGSGSVFSRMQYILRNESRSGRYYSRDSAAIAYACRDANAQFIDSVFLDALKKVDHDFKSAVDLGSGSGERLMQVLDCYPGSTAIGIDIAGPAIEVAKVGAVKRGYGDRITFLEGDARRVEYRDEFSEVDLLTSFLMGHDFWPRETCVSSLQMLRRSFPNIKRFFLCDTVRISIGDPESRHAVADDALPIFTLGFEFGHALMGVKLPTVEDWEGVFQDGGWRCIKQHHMCPPSLTVLFELVPLEAKA